MNHNHIIAMNEEQTDPTYLNENWTPFFVQVFRQLEMLF